MTVEPLSRAEAELLRVLVQHERPVASFRGPADDLESALLPLVRRRYVELRDEEGPVAPREAQRILLAPLGVRRPGLVVRATEEGRKAWRSRGIAADRSFAGLEREARHLRGF